MAMEPGSSPSAEALLRHAGFVRGIARGMLEDRHAAEDVVQDTLLATVHKPPKDTGRLRAWMAVVARNLSLRTRRGGRRRSRRERAAARPERLPDTADVAAELELQRRVVAEVERLEEPYRSTVVHRFFHGWTTREIASAEGVSKKAVESRITRALARLRARLQRSNPAGLVVALAALAWPRRAHAGKEATAVATGGAVTMGIKGKTTAIAALLLLAVGSVVGIGWVGADGATSTHADQARAERLEPQRTTETDEPPARCLDQILR